MNPLVEVVQDTVGRHDSFNLACTARYYEDQGYFGHANCSDNFTGKLAEHGLPPQKGWPAINLFFNTAVDAQSVIHFDEPWSRPGDYVLLRAMTDLVCASSACPCDIDAANGWVLTDIHVRVYPETNLFKRAVGYRMTPDAPLQLTKETGFHARVAALTRDLVEYRGYWLPNSFAKDGPIEEYWACRERCVAIDLSPLRKFEVLGPDAETLLQRTLTRNVRRLAVGQVVYSAMCYEHGGMIDDGTLFRHGADQFRWIGGDDYGGIWLKEQAARLGLERPRQAGHRPDPQPLRPGPALARDPARDRLDAARPPVGRRARLVPLHRGPDRRLPGHPDRDLAHRLHGRARLRGLLPPQGRARRLGRRHAGRRAVRHRAHGPGRARHGADRGRPGLRRLRVRQHHRPVRGRHRLRGRGEGRGLDRQGGAGAHARPTRRSGLVGLELASNEATGKGDPVFVGRAQVGHVTSATRSPVLKKNLALARLDVAHADLGGEVEIGKLDGLQKRLPATVVRFPFYDPGKTRVRA